MSFFQKLYEGKYAPIQEETPQTAEFKEQWKKMERAGEELRKTLSQEQLNLLEAHQNAQVEIEGILLLQSFRQGFHIGAEFQKDFMEIDHLPDKE